MNKLQLAMAHWVLGARPPLKPETCVLLLLAMFLLPVAEAQPARASLADIDWSRTIRVSRSTPTLQVVTNPMLNRGSPIHDGAFRALKALGADYVRYVPWLPYPKIAVA